MAMTTGTMTPIDSEKLKANLTAAQVKLAASQVEDPLAGVKEDLEDQIVAEEKAAAQVLQDQQSAQEKASGIKMSDLVEDDAYNLEIAIVAAKSYSPNFLRIDMKDKNYVARWGNTNSIRQGQLVAQGFKYLQPEDVENLNELEMHIDSQGRFVWADLIAVKTTKASYYSGLRRAYMKSLHATNDKKAREVGSQFAKTNLTSNLTGPERGYLSQQEQAGTSKPIYNPNIGV
jgi:hypothetical protein